MRLSRLASLVAALALAGGIGGCGYTLQNSRSPLSDKEGIKRIYIRPFVNNTYKVGVENLVFNALLKNLVAHRRIAIVGKPDEADAVLEGTVTVAQYIYLAGTQVTIPGPNGFSRTVTSQYNATLGCTFSLTRRNPAPGQKVVLWNGGFSRSRPFASAVQAGVRGETTAPLNESEFDRALFDIANFMVSEVHESMLAMF